MSRPGGRRRTWEWRTSVFVAVLSVAGCSDDGGEDLRPSESEVGERDTEIVPGEGGPVE